jgi:uncharacterized protein DUF6644
MRSLESLPSATSALRSPRESRRRLFRDCQTGRAQNVTVAFFVWLENTSVAMAVRDTLLLNAGLSAVHLIGFTLVTGGGLVANLNLLGVLLPGRSAIEVSRPASRGIALGLAISVLTGVFLFAPRATIASVNWIFQLKMALLATAVLFHVFVHRRVARSPGYNHISGHSERSSSSGAQRATAVVGLLLWTGLALSGCAFILLE